MKTFYLYNFLNKYKKKTKLIFVQIFVIIAYEIVFLIFFFALNLKLIPNSLSSDSVAFEQIELVAIAIDQNLHFLFNSSAFQYSFQSDFGFLNVISTGPTRGEPCVMIEIQLNMLIEPINKNSKANP
ncbi:hypothetical protein BpHYR1_054652 [Brachionus plicatilis]|uniref:Uncharacterized protein n=1 Tax=Brachionus plicatilis TaxID=10195 RepID=A0A3M7PWQ0_BRAPC|nr:hypothetical protein BpHYR1_054652 [Brachionus plicatilis]